MGTRGSVPFINAPSEHPVELILFAQPRFNRVKRALHAHEMALEHAAAICRCPTIVTHSTFRLAPTNVQRLAPIGAPANPVRMD
jgi:hypothetical protein